MKNYKTQVEKELFSLVYESKKFQSNMKKVPTSSILDKLHRGVVITCIGLTLYGTALIGHRVYRYFTVVKPQREISDLKMLEVKIFIEESSELNYSVLIMISGSKLRFSVACRQST